MHVEVCAQHSYEIWGMRFTIVRFIAINWHFIFKIIFTNSADYQLIQLEGFTRWDGPLDGDSDSCQEFWTNTSRGRRGMTFRPPHPNRQPTYELRLWAKAGGAWDAVECRIFYILHLTWRCIWSTAHCIQSSVLMYWKPRAINTYPATIF